MAQMTANERTITKGMVKRTTLEGGARGYQSQCYRCDHCAPERAKRADALQDALQHLRTPARCRGR